MGIDGVNGLSKQNNYDDSDLEAMKGREALSTNAAINRIGNHAGLSDTHALSGSDKTSSEIVAEHRAAVQKDWTPGGADVVEHGAAHAAEHFAEHGMKEVLPRLAFRAAAGVALPIHLIQAGYEMATSVAEDSKVGHERAAALVKSAMHTVVLGSLNGLPQAFVDSQRARYAADAPSGLVKRMSDAMGRGDNAFMGIIQLHCDQGIGAARAMFDAKQAPADYLKAHPELASRMADDIGFKAGFEGAMYAHEHGQYDDVMKALAARDARYDAHHIAWRG